MPIMRPISNLRNYGSILRDCKDGEPVFLTRNGRECYVIVDVSQWERLVGKTVSRASDSTASNVPGRFTREETEEMEFFCELVDD